MFKKAMFLALTAATLLTTGNLRAVQWHSNDWTNFGLGVGLGVLGAAIYNNKSSDCNNVAYCEPNYSRNRYDYIGDSTVADVFFQRNARVITLGNGMVFEIARGSYDWTGYRATVYRDASRGVSGNYVLMIGGNEYYANRVEPAPILVPRYRYY